MTPHQRLGLAPGADDDAIRRAFRQKALEWHPDRNPAPNAAAEFQACVEAYEALRGRRAAPPVEPPRPTERPRRRRRRGADISVDLFVTTGGPTRLDVVREVVCTACDGPWVGTSCPGCRGSGKQKVIQSVLKIGVESTIRCEVCGGSGWLPPEPCEPCQDRGVLQRAVAVEVDAPAQDGAFIHLAGQGHCGLSGGRPGELRVRVSHVRGVDVAVTPDLARSGGAVRVRTPKGEVRMTVPPGSISGTRMRLRGQGSNGTDLLAVLRITTARKGTSEHTDP